MPGRRPSSPSGPAMELLVPPSERPAPANMPRRDRAVPPSHPGRSRRGDEAPRDRRGASSPGRSRSRAVDRRPSCIAGLILFQPRLRRRARGKRARDEKQQNGDSGVRGHRLLTLRPAAGRSRGARAPERPWDTHTHCRCRAWMTWAKWLETRCAPAGRSPTDDGAEIQRGNLSASDSAANVRAEARS